MHRKGQVPEHIKEYNALVAKGYDVEDVTCVQMQGKVATVVDMATPYVLGGMPVKARCWEGIPIGHDEGQIPQFPMVYVKYGPYEIDVTNFGDPQDPLLDKPEVPRGQDGNAVERRDIVADVTKMSAAAVKRGFVMSYPSYKASYYAPGGTADQQAAQGVEPDDLLAYSQYIAPIPGMIESGSMQPVGKIRTAEQARAAVAEFEEYRKDVEENARIDAMHEREFYTSQGMTDEEYGA